MIEISSFLSGKNLCNIFADQIVRKINELSPDAKTQISVINLRSFFIVRGSTTSENVINISDILSEIYQRYDENLDKTVRVIDTIFYNKKPSTNLLIHFKNTITEKKEFKNLKQICDNLISNGHYLNLKVSDDKIFYDLDHDGDDMDNVVMSKSFSNYECIKSDFSNDFYFSDPMYGLSISNGKYFYFLLNKISFNLINRGFCKTFDVVISSDLPLEKINSENIILQIKNESVLNKTNLESLILDNFSFDLSDLQKEFSDSDEELISYLSDTNKIMPWENYEGTRDLMFL